MARYASGKRSWGILRSVWFSLSFRDMIKEWNGAKVGRDEYEEKTSTVRSFKN